MSPAETAARLREAAGRGEYVVFNRVHGDDPADLLALCEAAEQMAEWVKSMSQQHAYLCDCTICALWRRWEGSD